MPPTLGEAIGTEPAWLQAWVFALGFVHLAALVFAVGRTGGRWIVRPEPVAVIVSFVAAGIAMGWLYEQVGSSGCSVSRTWSAGRRPTRGWSLAGMRCPAGRCLRSGSTPT